MGAAARAGAAAEEAALGKERSWAAQAEAQGETFYPLAIEAGGAVMERFREFLVTLALPPRLLLRPRNVPSSLVKPCSASAR